MAFTLWVKSSESQSWNSGLRMERCSWMSSRDKDNKVARDLVFPPGLYCLLPLGLSVAFLPPKTTLSSLHMFLSLYLW